MHAMVFRSYPLNAVTFVDFNRPCLLLVSDTGNSVFTSPSMNFTGGIRVGLFDYPVIWQLSVCQSTCQIVDFHLDALKEIGYRSNVNLKMWLWG